MVSLVLIAALLAPASACPIATSGRISIGVDGLSEGCCAGVSGVFTTAMKAEEKAMETHNPVDPQVQQQVQMQAMMTFKTKCCGASDQEVLKTLVPHIPEKDKQQMEMGIGMMCGSGGPPGMDIFELIGLSAPLGLLSNSPRMTKVAAAGSNTGMAAVVGGLAGAALSLVVLKLGNFNRKGSQPLLSA